MYAYSVFDLEPEYDPQGLVEPEAWFSAWPLSVTPVPVVRSLISGRGYEYNSIFLGLFVPSSG